VPGTPFFIGFSEFIALFGAPVLRRILFGRRDGTLVDVSTIARWWVDHSDSTLVDVSGIPPRGQTRLKLTFPAKGQKIDQKVVKKRDLKVAKKGIRNSSKEGHEEQLSLPEKPL
jgi:hypothetical protein